MRAALALRNKEVDEARISGPQLGVAMQRSMAPYRLFATYQGGQAAP